MTAPATRPRRWQHATGSLRLEVPVVMAVLNVTPDSFHDGGRFGEGANVQLDRVRAAARAAVEHGAGVLDVGGESTRPGAEPVDPDEERRRVLPTIGAIVGLGVPVSIDTRRASVAQAALEAGASIVNDVSGLADPAMAEVVAQAGAGVVIGHMRGDPKSMQARVTFEDLIGEVARELSEAVARARRAGVDMAQILVDPGIGFGKTAPQSAALVVSAAVLEARVGVPVMVGASRKSFIGAVMPSTAQQRLAGSLAAAVLAVGRGAAVLRVHDVPETMQALAVAAAIERAAVEVA